MGKNKYEHQEVAGGRCPDCGEPARLRTCHVCGKSLWLIDCGHYGQPRPISADDDGTGDICDDCYDLRK